MVKKDLERVGIPYETHEGIADFHAAGRHSHVTGLLRNGATIIEARELARHADVRMTMKYTHIGLEDQAEALAGLPAPFPSKTADWLGIGWDSGGTKGHPESPDDTDPGPDGMSINEQTPAGPGVVSSSVVSCHQKAVYSEVEAAGIAPASREASVAVSTCVAIRLVVGIRAPVDKVPFSLAGHEFNSNSNQRLCSSDPELTSLAGALGRRAVAGPFCCF